MGFINIPELLIDCIVFLRIINPINAENIFQNLRGIVVIARKWTLLNFDNRCFQPDLTAS